MKPSLNNPANQLPSFQDLVGMIKRFPRLFMVATLLFWAVVALFVLSNRSLSKATATLFIGHYQQVSLGAEWGTAQREVLVESMEATKRRIAAVFPVRENGYATDWQTPELTGLKDGPIDGTIVIEVMGLNQPAAQNLTKLIVDKVVSDHANILAQMTRMQEQVAEGVKREVEYLRKFRELSDGRVIKGAEDKEDIRSTSNLFTTDRQVEYLARTATLLQLEAQLDAARQAQTTPTSAGPTVPAGERQNSWEVVAIVLSGSILAVVLASLLTLAVGYAVRFRAWIVQA